MSSEYYEVHILKLPRIFYCVRNKIIEQHVKQFMPILKGGHSVMTITDIKIRKIIPDGRLRAVISITIDGMLAVHDIKVVQGEERLFVAMPSRKDESGNFRDIVHPISPEARSIIESQILDAYKQHMDQIAAESEADEMGL
jgi:stage V sporulation protein G